MPLRDHFHPPLSQRRHWHAFHNAWATYIAAELNQHLPEGYFAEPNVQFGIEIDVAAFHDSADFLPPPSATIQSAWQPPLPTYRIPFEPADETVEVTIFQTREGPILTGVIELVSPANKDRAAHREAFVAKCETYLHQGLGLIIVDIVTDRNANLHTDLLARLSPETPSQISGSLYAVAYRVVTDHEQSDIDIWPHELALEHPLPTLPLWLRGDICLPIDLQGSYERTCREHRIT